MNCRFPRTWGALALLLWAGCTPPPQAATPPTPAVNVALPIERNVSDQEEFTGRTDAVSRVDIRARVSGYLMKVNFRDGDIVKLDDLLYEIDRRPFQDALDEAEGAVERLKAEKKLMDIQVDRYRKLAEKGAGSQQDLDEYMAKQAGNIGALKSATAAVAHAQLNLDFTRIAAPIAGKISRTLLTAGNLVNADATMLTTIMSIDPIYAYFNVEEPTLLRIQKMRREGVIKQQLGEIEVEMGLADDVERKFPLRGKLDFANNTVDPQTGTILVRGTFANPYEMPNRPPVLMPGLFVRVRLNMGPPHKAFLVNERAIGTNQGQKYIYVVDKDNKVAYRRVVLGQLVDGLQAIEEGLKAEDRVVVNGLQRIRPGIAVKPETVEMAAVATK